jgi:undecaprenyl-diphosphatase
VPRPLAATLARLILSALALPALAIGLGLLVTRGLTRALASEDDLVRDLAEGRTASMDRIAAGLADLGGPVAVFSLLMLAAGLLRWWLGRWHEPLLVGAAVILHGVAHVSGQIAVDRAGPRVTPLDAPPVTSYPAGRVGAAVALYGALALVVGWYLRHHLARAASVVVLLVIPAAVAYAVLYRGSHHPSDVGASVVLGVGAVVAAAWATMSRPPDPAQRYEPLVTPTTIDLRRRLRTLR